MVDFDVLINGVIFNALSNWKSSYKIPQDLPYIAEEITLAIIKKLEGYDYIIIKEKTLGRIL